MKSNPTYSSLDPDERAAVVILGVLYLIWRCIRFLGIVALLGLVARWLWFQV